MKTDGPQPATSLRGLVCVPTHHGKPNESSRNTEVAVGSEVAVAFD